MIQVRRVAKTVKGGRIMSFSALSVVGDGDGGIGIGKGRQGKCLQLYKKVLMLRRNL